jgi:hypothetical protein
MLPNNKKEYIVGAGVSVELTQTRMWIVTNAHALNGRLQR